MTHRTTYIAPPEREWSQTESVLTIVGFTLMAVALAATSVVLVVLP